MKQRSILSFSIIALILLGLALSLPSQSENQQQVIEANPFYVNAASPHTYYFGNTVEGSCAGKCENLATTSGTADTTTSQKIGKSTGEFKVEPDVSSSTTTGTISTLTPSGYAWETPSPLGATILAGTVTLTVTVKDSVTSGTGYLWAELWSCGSISEGTCTSIWTEEQTSTNVLGHTSATTETYSISQSQFVNCQYLALELWIDVTSATSSNTATITETTVSTASSIGITNLAYSMTASGTATASGSLNQKVQPKIAESASANPGFKQSLSSSWIGSLSLAGTYSKIANIHSTLSPTLTVSGSYNVRLSPSKFTPSTLTVSGTYSKIANIHSTLSQTLTVSGSYNSQLSPSKFIPSSFTVAGTYSSKISASSFKPSSLSITGSESSRIAPSSFRPSAFTVSGTYSKIANIHSTLSPTLTVSGSYNVRLSPSKFTPSTLTVSGSFTGGSSTSYSATLVGTFSVSGTFAQKIGTTSTPSQLSLALLFSSSSGHQSSGGGGPSPPPLPTPTKPGVPEVFSTTISAEQGKDTQSDLYVYQAGGSLQTIVFIAPVKGISINASVPSDPQQAEYYVILDIRVDSSVPTGSYIINGTGIFLLSGAKLAAPFQITLLVTEAFVSWVQSIFNLLEQYGIVVLISVMVTTSGLLISRWTKRRGRLW